MKVRNSILSAALFAMAITPAQAAFQVMVGATTITDNGAGDLSPVANSILYIDLGSGVNFLFNQGSATSTNTLGTLTISNTGHANTGAASSIQVKVTDTGYTSPVGLGTLDFKLTANSQTATGVVTGEGFYGPGNTPFELGTGTGVATVSTFGTDQSTSVGPINFTAPFSLTQVIDITLDAGPAGREVVVTGTLAASPVPEPGAIVLLGTALLGTVLVTRKKLSRS